MEHLQLRSRAAMTNDRDILLDRHREYDEISAFQVGAQKLFAAENGWVFIDLTDPLKEKVAASKTWIYGRYDGDHWSQSCTEIVSDVLTDELSRIVRQ
jgi:hypothetical protein